ncbi:MAG: glycosyltransferase family 4 protein [Gemmatimonadota bacterium]
MRILFVSHSFPLPQQPLSNVGGMQRVAVELHAALAQHSEVELSSFVLETSWRWTAVRTPPFLLHALAAIPRRVRMDRIDVVLFSSMVTASIAPLIHRRVRAAGALLAAIPVGRDVTLPNPIYQRLVPRILKSLDLVLPISRATAETCLSRGAVADRVRVVPCGTTFPSDPPAIDRSGKRSAVLDLLAERGCAPGPDALLLLSVGRHQERKGFHWFVEEVMPRAGQETVYLLAGSGPMAGAIQQAVERRGLGDRVILLGKVSEDTLQTLYAGADVFIMPNIPVPGDIEGFGVVMVEAGAAGLPVLAADLEGIRDVIAEGRNGRLLPTGDAGAFADALDDYRDRERLSTASLEAAAHVRSRFAWPAIANEHVQIFGEALKASAKDRQPAP